MGFFDPAFIQNIHIGAFTASTTAYVGHLWKLDGASGDAKMVDEMLQIIQTDIHLELVEQLSEVATQDAPRIVAAPGYETKQPALGESEAFRNAMRRFATTHSVALASFRQVSELRDSILHWRRQLQWGFLVVMIWSIAALVAVVAAQDMLHPDALRFLWITVIPTGAFVVLIAIALFMLRAKHDGLTQVRARLPILSPRS